MTVTRHQLGQPHDAYAHSNLWETATRFITNALDALDEDKSEQAALWAACSLEILGKSALSKISPVLIADSGTDPALAAIGVGAAGDRTRKAFDIYTMCAMTFEGFDLSRAKKIAADRNAEIHSGSRPFETLRPSWWQSFWSLAALLAIAQDRTVLELAGSGARAAYVSDQISKNKDFVAQQAKGLVERAAHRLAVVNSPKGDAEVAEYMRTQVQPLWFEYEFNSHTSATCPACQHEAVLYGMGASQEISPVPGAEYREVKYIFESQAFYCETCKLTLAGPAYIQAVDLPVEFYVVGVID